MKLFLSSEVYAIESLDLMNLSESSEGEIVVSGKDSVVILIGNSAKGESDLLLKGRTLIEQSIATGVKYVSARIAFRSAIPEVFSFLSAFKQIRKKYKYHSKGVYHMSAREIRRMRIERAIRSGANAYGFRNKKWRPEESDRLPKYQRLIKSIAENGYDDNEPISIMLCRSFGVLDSLDQGHHRVSAALDAKVDRIAVCFSAVSKPPFLFAKLLLIFAKMKRSKLCRQYELD